MTREEIIKRMNQIDEGIFVAEMCDHYDGDLIFKLKCERDNLSKELIKIDESKSC